MDKDPDDMTVNELANEIVNHPPTGAPNVVRLVKALKAFASALTSEQLNQAADLLFGYGTVLEGVLYKNYSPDRLDSKVRLCEELATALQKQADLLDSHDRPAL